MRSSRFAEGYRPNPLRHLGLPGVLLLRLPYQLIKLGRRKGKGKGMGGPRGILITATYQPGPNPAQVGCMHYCTFAQFPSSTSACSRIQDLLPGGGQNSSGRTSSSRLLGCDVEHSSIFPSCLWLSSAGPPLELSRPSRQPVHRQLFRPRHRPRKQRQKRTVERSGRHTTREAMSERRSEVRVREMPCRAVA